MESKGWWYGEHKKEFEQEGREINIVKGYHGIPARILSTGESCSVLSQDVFTATGPIDIMCSDVSARPYMRSMGCYRYMTVNRWCRECCSRYAGITISHHLDPVCPGEQCPYCNGLRVGQTTVKGDPAVG